MQDAFNRTLELAAQGLAWIPTNAIGFALIAVAILVRALVSAQTSPRVWDLRCEVREKLIAYLRQDYPHALPRQRAEVDLRHPDAAMNAGLASHTGRIMQSPQLSPAESGS